MIKNIYMIWYQGWKHAPEICKRCLDSWKEKNPSWTVHALDKTHLKNMLGSEYIESIYSIRPYECLVDVIRLKLIYEYGGLYVDSTILCNKSLDLWLYNDLLVNDTWLQFDYDFPRPSINFLYSNKVHNSNFDLAGSEFTVPAHSLRTDRYSMLWTQGLDAEIENLRNRQAVNSSNAKKQGVKIIANDFLLMNESIDEDYACAFQRIPYFKLTHKYQGNFDDLHSVFQKNSRLLYLLGETKYE